MLGIVYPLYYSSFALAVAAASPNAEIGNIVFATLFSFVITLWVSGSLYQIDDWVVCSNGVMQPFRQLGWWRWMYRLSPYTYLIEGLLGQGDYSLIAIFFYDLTIPPAALGHQTIQCSDVELVQLNPPSGMTCAQYLNPFISSAGGYLVNPDVTTACSFCSMSTADQFLASGFNIFYDHAWRNFGLMFAYIVFNVRL